MKAIRTFISVLSVLVLCCFVQADELVIEDFESYVDSAELLTVWAERNPTVAALSLETLEAKAGYNSMVVDYNSRYTPYWSEAYNILPAAQDWSEYKTLNVWVKGYIGLPPGHTRNQSAENMYVVVYKAKDGYPNPVDHSQLDMLGKVVVYRATKIADWTVLRFNLGQNFEPLTAVRAFGIGIQPDSYGTGVVKLDAITLSTESYGGIINNFEQYESTSQLQSALDVNDGTICSTMELALAAEDANVIYGNKALKFSFNHGLDPYWSKIMFYLPRTLKYAWGPKTFNDGGNYSPLTVNFKVMDAESRMQVVLIGTDGLVKAVYHYPDEITGPTYRVPTGDWIRWDILPQSVYDRPEASYDELDSIGRVELQFLPIDYGVGQVYVDDVYVNNCGEGVGSPVVGNLRADFNKDCVIDFMDMVVFAEHWQQTGCAAGNQYCGGADFSIGGTRDGKVDFKDLVVVVDRWLDCNFLYEGDCF